MTLDFSEDARQQIREAGVWLYERDPDAARLFSEVLEAALPALCERLAAQIAVGSLPRQPDEGASLYYARPVFLELVTATRSGKRARRSSAATWRVYYELMDTDGDQLPDVLRVLAVRHAAARPLDIDAKDYDATGGQ